MRDGNPRRRGRQLVIGVLAVCLAFGSLAGVAEAKKKKKKSSTITVTKAVNQVVPPAVTGPPYRTGLLLSTIPVGKAFKGKEIGDVNVTIGWSATGAGSDWDDIQVALSAPNGATSYLNSGNLFQPPGAVTLGPLTLDDETPFFTSGNDAADDQETYALYAPYAGRSQPNYPPLAVMDGGPARGTWTLSILNYEDVATEVHTFGSWTLEVKTHGKYAEK
jgi:hypothetical protein